MTGNELLRLLKTGQLPVVEFTREIEDYESCIDRGMRARITRAELYTCDTIKVSFSLNEFEAHNRTFEKANYYNKVGEPVLTAREAGYYPKDGIESIVFRVNEDFDAFHVVDANPLVVEHLNADTKLSYVEWLESELMKAREHATALGWDIDFREGR